MAQDVRFTNAVDGALRDFLARRHAVVVADTNTRTHCLPLLPALADSPVIAIEAGERHKNLASLEQVWQGLTDCHATRSTVAVCLGGGTVTDLGGFAAATFKRGLPAVNVPTTLLSAVDAAVGGKTGINFGGLKNQIGAFAPAELVVVSTMFFPTLPEREFLSGYAELLKTALLSGEEDFDRATDADPARLRDGLGGEHLPDLLRRAVEFKMRIADEDPYDRGPRHALNLGHTVGHAFEHLAFTRRQPVEHGYAVAWGLVAEAVVARLQTGFPSECLYRLARFVGEHYPVMNITCDDYPALISAMKSDKKSLHGEINCTLPTAPGHYLTDVAVGQKQMTEALDIFRDLMGI